MNVNRLNLLDGGLVYASINDDTGMAGNIYINASESVVVSGFVLYQDNGEETNIRRSKISSSYEGSLLENNVKGGEIVIKAPYLKLIDAGILDGSSSNIILDVYGLDIIDGAINKSIYNETGSVGDLIINASEYVNITGKNDIDTNKILAGPRLESNGINGLLSIKHS